jgi:GntR family transcriptional regulator
MQLTGLLCRQIDSGQLPPHAQLPSERDLCQQYGVSRTTVRKALAQLLYKGRIYTSVGKGTYVAAQTLHEELQPLSSFTDDVRRRGMRAGTRILEAEIVPASDALAARLQVPQGAEVVRLYRLRLADDMPIALQRTHLPHHLCPDILQHDLSSRSLFELLRTEYHLHMAGADTDIEAVLARPEEARLLQLSDPAAVLISEQTTYLDTDAVIELTRSVFRGDRYKLHTHTCLGQLRP